jgi:hypothetical protein
VSNQTKPADVTIPAGAAEMRKLLERARKGDASTLPVLRKMLEDPATVDALGGNLARQAELSLIAKAAGDNLSFKESLTRKLELLRAELAGPSPGPVERLLVERVVACWLHLSHLEMLYAQKDSMTLDVGMYFQRCLSAAQRRYLSALKALALVRKLALPSGQPASKPAPLPGLPNVSRNGTADPGRNGVPVLN